MAQTPRLRLGLFDIYNAQPERPANVNMRFVDLFLQPALESNTDRNPPGGPYTDGDMFGLPSNANGVWKDFPLHIAIYNAEATDWQFFEMPERMFWIVDQTRFEHWNGTGWTVSAV